jgi:hypothetical protein
MERPEGVKPPMNKEIAKYVDGAEYDDLGYLFETEEERA